MPGPGSDDAAEEVASGPVAEWARVLRDGDADRSEEALEQLVTLLESDLLRYLRFFGWSGEDGRAIANEAFFRSWRGRRRIREPERYPALVRKIAVRVAQQAWKRAARARGREVELDDATVEGLMSRERAPRGDGDADAGGLLAGVPRKIRDPMEWKYVDGLTLKEIARRLDRTVDQVEYLLVRGRALLKERRDEAGAQRRDGPGTAGAPGGRGR